MNNVVVIIVAHADDEALGCGGTIARHVSDGDSVHAIFLADGVTSRENVNQEQVEQRELAAEKAHEILGFNSVEYLGFPDNQLDSMPLLEIVKKLEMILEALSPNIIYTHYHGDLNIDHQICYQAVMTACRPLPGNKIKEIYSFEVMSSTDWSHKVDNIFSPHVYIDISDFIEIKVNALNAYDNEMHDSPHSRSVDHIKSLAVYRGNSVGLHAAEAFMAIRLIK